MQNSGTAFAQVRVMFRNRLARFISAALNAPFIALISFISLIAAQWSTSSFLLILITSLFASLLPLASIMILAKRGAISDVYASDRRTRFKPFMMAIAFYLVGLICLLIVRAPSNITAFMASYLVNAFVLLVISLAWKISIHTSGIAGPVTALVFNLGARMIPFFLLAVPVAWARMELKAHDYKQVLAGMILASSLTWFQMTVYVNFLF